MQHYSNNRGAYGKIVSCSINNNIYITIDVDFLSLICYSVGKLLEKQKKQKYINNKFYIKPHFAYKSTDSWLHDFL